MSVAFFRVCHCSVYSPDSRRFTVLADEKFSAFLELERVTGVALGQADQKLTVCRTRSAFGLAAIAHPRVFQHKNSLSVDRRMSASSSAIKRTCAFLDNRKHLEDSPTHCSSNAGVSSEAFESDKRRFTTSRRRGTRGPHVFLRA